MGQTLSEPVVEKVSVIPCTSHVPSSLSPPCLPLPTHPPWPWRRWLALGLANNIHTFLLVLLLWVLGGPIRQCISDITNWSLDRFSGIGGFFDMPAWSAMRGDDPADTREIEKKKTPPKFKRIASRACYFATKEKRNRETHSGWNHWFRRHS